MARSPKTQTNTFGSTGRNNHDSSKFYQSRLYSEQKIHQVENVAENTFPNTYIDKIIISSSVKMLEIPDSSIHLMITSPPYNVSKEYDQDLSLSEYLELLSSVLQETYRVLVNGGRACVNIANLGRKPYIPLSSLIHGIMQELGFNLRGEIIWNKAASASSSTAWGSWRSASNPTLRDIHEYILVYSKGTFQRERGEKQNSMTKEQFMEWTKSIWTFSAESARRIGHPAPFPIELPRRLIHLYSFEGDMVLDPFMGSGTTAVASRQAKRHFVGYEIDPGYIDLAYKRVQLEGWSPDDLFMGIHQPEDVDEDLGTSRLQPAIK